MKQLIEAIKSECPVNHNEATNNRGAIKLRNIVTGEESIDVAHTKAANPVKCTSDVCNGSVQSFLNLTTNEPRDAKQVLKEAHEFLIEYFGSKKSTHSSEYKERMNEVIKEIMANGTYTLTEDELTYGAKLAWRNAPRCIGRVYWNTLKVFDARNVKSSEEMFEALCNHIKYSTNNGKLRSAITVFPQRKPGNSGDFKVWNSQLVAFAGYVDPNDPNKIIGDPMRVEFTQLCEKLGWKGKRTNFDILPLVLSANGGDPKVFPIPEELILTVRLRHPKYKWFEDLNLEWYALPAVSNMLFDIGGIEFPAAPFNGWFMATEIACRDLCDRHRYNILEKVAVKLGLDTRSNATLWKDFALLEIHVAVVDSFQKQGITIVDHHTASESFLRHFETEKRLRGGCPADWAWIVPPTSSGITPVFHQEMLCYKLKPSFEYQENAWKTHKWHNAPQCLLKRKLCFKVFATAALFTSKLYTKSLSLRTKVTIIYATETGKSEDYAKRLAQLFRSAFNVSVVCMDAYDLKNLREEQLLLVVTSTFGNGEAPENGESFARQVEAMQSGRTRFPFRYAVFALGSSAYSTFCAFGKSVDTLLSKHGHRIMNVVTGDEVCGEEQSFLEWSKRVFKTSCECFRIQFNVDADSSCLSSKIWSKKSVKLVPLLKSMPSEVSSGLQSLIKGANRKISPFKLKYRRDFFKCNSFDRRTIFVQLEFMANEDEIESKDGLQIDYLPGDHLALYPENSNVIVDRLLHRLDVIHADDGIEVFVQKDSVFIPCEKLPPTTIREAFTRYLDITSPPSQQFLTLLLQFCEDLQQHDALKLLATDYQYYEQWKSTNSPTLVDVLEEFSSLEPPLELLLTELPTLKPRFYSISSSPLYTSRQYQLSNKSQSKKEKENESRNEKNDRYADKSVTEPKTTIDLTVAVVNYKTSKGSQRSGVCSNFLADVPLGHKIYGYIRSAPNFKLPEDPSVPIVMVGPGTGIAPLRSFWLRRFARLKLCPNETANFGKMSLFFGCQVPEMRLYTDEIEKMKEKGVLNTVHNAYSRVPDQPKKYVQDIVKDHASEIFNELFEDKGHIYICGDTTMAKDVYGTLKSILHENGVEDSELVLSQMKKELRYHEDIYGVRHRSVTEGIAS